MRQLVGVFGVRSTQRSAKDVHIAHLRNRLVGSSVEIETVLAVGYSWLPRSECTAETQRAPR